MIAKLRQKSRTMLAYAFIAGAIAGVHFLDTGRATREDEHTRSAVCLILSQVDGTTYAEKKANKIGKNEAKQALIFTATFRKQIGPAPYCIGHVLKEGETAPIRPAPTVAK